MKILYSLIVCHLFFLSLTAQTEFGYSFLNKLDTLFYPFYNNIQMIEVDHASFRNRKVMALEMGRPRAIPYNMLEPPASPNEYIFRNRTGTVIKAYNTPLSTGELTRIFGKKTMMTDAIHPSGTPVPLFHKRYYQIDGLWQLANKKPGYFHGFYKVYSDHSLEQKKNSQRIALIKNQRVGLIDSMGNQVIPFVYQDLFPILPNLIARQNDLYGIITPQQKILLPIVYDFNQWLNDEVVAFGNNEKIERMYLLPKQEIIAVDKWDRVLDPVVIKKGAVAMFVKDGKYGFRNHLFQPVSPYLYDVVVNYPNPENSLYPVSRNNRWGYVNKQGEEVIACNYADALPFDKSGLALVQLEGVYHYINTRGDIEYQIPTIAPKTERDNENKSIVKRNGKMGLMADDGSILLPIVYDYIYLRREDKYYHLKLDKKVGLANVNGKVVLPVIYDDVSEISPHTKRARIQLDNKLGLIDDKMNIMVPCIYESMMWSETNHIVVRKNNKFGIIDLDGNIIIPILYDFTYGFKHSGFVTLKKDGKAGMANLKNEIIIPFIYEDLSFTPVNNRIWMKQKGKYGYLDLQGNIVVAAQYDEVQDFNQAITGVKKGKNWGFIDTLGNVMGSFEYDHIDNFWMAFKYCEVRKNNKSGVIKTNGELLLPVEYDEILGYSHQTGFTVVKNKRRFRIFPNGKTEPVF